MRKLAPLDISNRNFVLLLSIIYEAKMNDRIHLPKVVISGLLHNFPADIAAAAAAVLPKHEERENQPKRKCRAANDSMSSY